MIRLLLSPCLLPRCLSIRHDDADRPVSKRDMVHGFALKACLAAIRGEIEPDTAHGHFASWAEKHDLLAPDVAAFGGRRE